MIDFLKQFFVPKAKRNNYKCDFCGSKETYVKEHSHNFKDGITFISERRFCSKCNNLVYDEDLDSKALKMALIMKNEKE